MLCWQNSPHNNTLPFHVHFIQREFVRQRHPERLFSASSRVIADSRMGGSRTKMTLAFSTGTRSRRTVMWQPVAHWFASTMCRRSHRTFWPTIGLACSPSKLPHCVCLTLRYATSHGLFQSYNKLSLHLSYSLFISLSCIHYFFLMFYWYWSIELMMLMC